MASGDEWQVVRRRKGGSRREKAPPTGRPEPARATDCSRDQRRVTDAMSELRGEDFWLEWRELLTVCAVGSCEDCVCYGLGSFSSCIAARYQLAMLLLILHTVRIPLSRCCVYDPVFSASECETLRALGLTVLTENEEGKRAVCRPTLFFLMHCGKALYNNLLWRNWSRQDLSHLVVIGNSFHGMQERMLQREFQRDYTFISAAMSVCEETALPCSPRFLDVFNDTALIRFPTHTLHTLPHTHTHTAEPQYQHCQDLEIIQRC